MITELRLGNFKAFSDTQKIPIKPLTIIFGPNSAGKSSLIHGIALAYHAIETGNLDVYSTSIGGESIDLGGFGQYVHRRNKDLNVEWAVELDVSKLSGRIAELLAPVKLIKVSLIFGLYESEVGKLHEEDFTEADWQKVFEEMGKPDKKDREALKDEILRLINTPTIRTCEISGDEKTFIRMSRRRDNSLRFDRLEPDHSVSREIFKAIVEFYTTTSFEALSDNDYGGFREAVSDLLNELTVHVNKFLPRYLLKDGKPLETKPSLIAPIGKGSRRENLANATKTFLPSIINELIQGLSSIIETEIKRFQYLGPLRSYPPRHIAFSQNEDINWFAGGGYAWDVVRKDYKIRKRVNAWLGDNDKLSTPYELTIRNLLTIDDLDKSYTKIIEDIEQRFANTDYQDDLFGEIYDALERLKGSEANISDIQELNLIDKRTNTVVSHRDVGIGISQVLPVLVGAYASKEKIIAIEQSEIHLHPALQAELGDVFIESALGQNKNTYILETHSEHLILRILRRIRETTSGELPKGQFPITPSDVSVIFVEPTPKGALLRELRINEDGEFSDKWPGGFFPERVKELF